MRTRPTFGEWKNLKSAPVQNTVWQLAEIIQDRRL
jgi:hypothetical protein